MAQSDQVAASADQQKAELAELPAELVRRFAEMAMMLPETESDGGASIIEAILNTADVHELGSPWGEKDQDALVGKWLIFTEASRSVSDFKGLGVFLVVQAVDCKTGEKLTTTTGSVNIVAQLVRAYTLDSFPLKARIMKAERPTKNGYWPLHLEIAEDQPARS